jgi:hypothetical protein
MIRCDGFLLLLHLLFKFQFGLFFGFFFLFFLYGRILPVSLSSVFAKKIDQGLLVFGAQAAND